MPTFILTAPVQAVHGFQQWSVSAADEKEALAKWVRGEAAFMGEEMTVTELGEPTITQE